MTVTITGSGASNIGGANGWQTSGSGATFTNLTIPSGKKLTAATIPLRAMLIEKGFIAADNFKIVQSNTALLSTYWTALNPGHDGVNGVKTGTYTLNSGLDDDGNGNFAFLLVNGDTMPVTFQIYKQNAGDGTYNNTPDLTITIDASGYTVE